MQQHAELAVSKQGAPVCAGELLRECSRPQHLMMTWHNA